MIEEHYFGRALEIKINMGDGREEREVKVEEAGVNEKNLP